MSIPQTHRGRTTNTFVVRMIDTHKGWTGVVTHVQSGRTVKFREFIEAVRFIDGFVATHEGHPKAGTYETPPR